MTMLNDQRLENLLRDAREVDAIERGGARFPMWARVSMMAAAAVVLLVLGAWFALLRSTPTAAAPDIAHGAPVETPSHGSVVMAVAEDESGKLKCVKWSANALGGKELDQVGVTELTRAGLSLSCDPAPVRMLVVGLQGPKTQLPDSDKRAQEIAECILKTPACGSGAFDAQFCAQAGCAGNGMQVRVEAIALK